MKNSSRIAAFACAFLAALAVPAAMADRPPKIIMASTPIYPYDLYRRGITGQATVEFTIDSHGQVQSLRVVKTSQKQFADAAMAAVHRWKFSPGIKDGRPINVANVQQTLFFDIPELRNRQESPSSPNSAQPSDQSPEVLSMVAPTYPNALRSENISGDVLVRFTVDKNGNVRDARVIEASSKEFGPAALAAIGQWKFRAGTRNHQSVDVENWQQHFEFQTDLPKAASKVIHNDHEAGYPDKMPIPIFRTVATYPLELALEVRHGEATVEFSIDTEGNVCNAWVVQETEKGFGQAAMDSILRWKFKPGMKNGHPVVTQRVQQNFVFDLDSS